MFKCLPFPNVGKPVERLDKRHCSLSEVPDDVLRHGKSLEECFLDANHLQALPKAFFRLNRLRKLGLSDNEIEHLPSDISHFASLEELDLSKNDISSLPEEIGQLKALHFLDVSSNPLSRLPDGLTQLSSLTILCLNDISLTELPEQFGNLVSLQQLELRDNVIKTLPKSFANLDNLLSLDLGSNEMEIFPALVCELRSLEVLLLDCNEISFIPPQIGRLKSLTTFDISDNHIDELPPEMGALSNLTDLLLSQNALHHLPATIGNMSRLSILKVDYNAISELPDSVGRCRQMTELVLISNVLADLPESIGMLTELATLNVDLNSLTELPKTVCNCRNLSILSLRKNRIQYLPDEIGDLEKLSVLDVSGNLIPYLPISVSKLGALKAIWLSENQSNSMPKFQIDVDADSGIEVLTCFLLPQQDLTPEIQPTLEKLRNDKLATSVQDVSLNIRHNTRVGFAGVETDSEEDEPNPNHNYFTRHDTPHPREFKTRHAQLFKNKDPHGSGTRPLDDVAKKEEKEHSSKPTTPEAVHNTEHREQRASTETIQVRTISQQNSEERRSPVLEERRGSQLVIQSFTEEPHGRGMSLPLQNVTVYEESRPKLQPRSPTIEWAPKKVEMPPPLPPRGPVADNGSVQVQSVHMIEVNAGSDEKRRIRSSDGSSVDEDSSDQDEAETSDVDEQVDGSHRVAFVDAGEEKNDKYSLRRQNTPHYNRGRRIVKEGQLAEEAKRKVEDIVARRKDRGLEEPVYSDQEGSRPPSATFVQTDRYSYTNAPTISPHPSPQLNHGTAVLQQTNYIVQTPSEIQSDAGSAVERTVKLVERSVDKSVDRPPPLPERIIPLSVEKSRPQEMVVKEVESHKTTVKNGDLPPVLPDRIRPSMMGTLPAPPVVTIVLIRSAGGLGLSIAGGKGSLSPFREDDEGIFISKITEGGPAYEAGLRVGDKLLTVNSLSLVDSTHHEAVEVLKNAGTNLVMTVQRDKALFEPRREMSVPSIPSQIEKVTKKQIVTVTLPKGKAGLGFSIAGGKGTAPYKDNDESIFVSKIAPGGIAEQSGSIFIGDKILSINNSSVENAKHSEAVKLLTAPGSEIVLQLERETPLQTKRYSYFVEPNRVNTVSTLRPSQSADFLSQVGGSALTLPPSWRARNGFHEPHSAGPVIEKVIESEKIVHGVPSRSGSSHELRTSPPPLPAKPRTKSIDDGVPVTNGPPKTLVSTGVVTDEPRSPQKVNRKLQVNTIEERRVEAPPPRLVTRSSQSDLVELVMREEKENKPIMPIQNQTVYASRTVIEKVDSVANGPQYNSPLQKRTYSASSYSNASTEPVYGTRPRYESVNATPPTDKRSPTPLQSSLKKESISSPDAGRRFFPKQEHVTVYTNGGPLGLSIVGGSDYWCAPFGSGPEDTGIFISKLVPGGAASKTNQLRIGDRILAVNGRDTANVSHAQAVDALRANPLRCELLVHHDPPPDGLQDFTIIKHPGETLGMNIRGGHGADVPGNPMNLRDDGIFISRVVPGGAAARDGRLRAGMRILEVNDESLLGCTHEDAVNALRKTVDRLTIMVCRGYDPDQAEAILATGLAVKHLSEVSPVDANNLRRKAQGQLRGDQVKAAEQIHEEMVKVHMEETLKRSAENEVQKMLLHQRQREEEQAVEARKRQVESQKNLSWMTQQKAVDLNEKALEEQQKRREEERLKREKQRWQEDMERMKRERAEWEKQVERRRKEEEERIRAEIQEKMESDRRKREEIVRQNRQRSSSAHSTRDVPPSPPPPLPVNLSTTITSTTTTKTYSYNSTIEKKDSNVTQTDGRGEKPIPPPVDVSVSGMGGGRPPAAQKPQSSVVNPSRMPPRGPLAAVSAESSNQNLKSPSAMTFREKQSLFFAKELETQPDEPVRGYLPARRDSSPPTMSRSDYTYDRSRSYQSYENQTENPTRGRNLPTYEPESTARRQSFDYLDYPKDREEPRTVVTLDDQFVSRKVVGDFPRNERGEGPERRVSEEQWRMDRGESDRLGQLPDTQRPIRTANAERRSIEKQMREGSGDYPSPDGKISSPARDRAEEAEKRAAWRADRLKSLDADTLKAQQIVRRMGELSRLDNRDSGFSAPSLDPTPTTEQSDLPRISLKEEVGEPRTKERSRLVDEKVLRKMEEHIDPDTGKKYLTTTETVEQTVEHETETSKQTRIRLTFDEEKAGEGQSDF